jgi:hypothetical protein
LTLCNTSSFLTPSVQLISSTTFHIFQVYMFYGNQVTLALLQNTLQLSFSSLGFSPRRPGFSSRTVHVDLWWKNGTQTTFLSRIYVFTSKLQLYQWSTFFRGMENGPITVRSYTVSPDHDRIT